MHRIRLAGLALTLVAATACSTTTTAPPTSVITVSSTVTVHRSTSAAPTPTRSTVLSSPTVTAVTGTVTLDKVSQAWFTAVCQNQESLKQFTKPDTPATLAAAKQVIVDAYANLSNSAIQAAGMLKSLPFPQVPNGPEVKRFQVAFFTAVANEYGAAAATIAAARPKTITELTTAVSTVETRVRANVTKSAGTTPALPANYLAAIAKLPACVGA